MSGLGEISLGIAPYGAGTPAVDEVGGGIPLQSTSGVQYGSRAIDAATGSYLFDSTTGQLRGMPDVSQNVQLALTTALGSSAQASLGSGLFGITDITANIDKRVSAAVNAALQSLVDARQVAILSVTTTKVKTSALLVRVRWRDLTTNTESATSVSLAG